MAEALGVDKRSTRSRSKTPGILFGENGNSDKKATKIPTISLIEEEDDVVEVVASQNSQGTRPKRQRRSAKAVVDTSGDVSGESPKNSQKSNVSRTTIVTETIVTKTTNGSESSEQTTTNVTKSAAHDVVENQTFFNNIFNAIKTSTPILSNKRSKRITQEALSPANIKISDHPAYKEYKEAGEYWNKYPKTDYTYSELSPHRRQLSNGVVAMPNMSRRSLEKYNNRVEMMIQNNPAEETFLRRKYFSNANSSFQTRSAELQYDSADEVDVTEFRQMLQARRKAGSNVVSRFFMLFVSYMYSAFYQVKEGVRGVFYRKDRYAYTPVRNQQGIFARGFESFKNFFLLGFSKVYLFVSTILVLDTWILYTRSENVVENRKRKRFLLFMLILLPLLLLGAWLLSDDETATQLLTFRTYSLPNLASVTHFFDDLHRPQLPEWNFNFSLGWLWAPFVYLGGGLKGFLFTSRASDQLKMSLDEDRLQMLIAHIDRYIDGAIGERLEQNNKIITKETNERTTLIIAGSVRDALVNYHYQLTAQDIDVIAGKIRKQMENEFNDKEKSILSRISLTNEANLGKIEEQIKRNVNLHFSEIKLDNQNVDLNEIILAILKSDKLLALIDGRIQPAFQKLEQHDAEIEEIKAGLFKLRGEVLKRFTGLEGDIGTIKLHQKTLGDDFYKFKLENDEKLQQLLIEIDGKLASIGDSHFTSVDASVRKNLLTILGFDFKSSGGDLSEDAIKNWISSIFVAKTDLEERLKQVELNGNKAFQLQLNENAGILMNEINEEIKKQIAVAVVAKSKEVEGSRIKVSGGLSEEDVIKIVKGVLAVYDADKTGLVDFALETAGGQVLSTRCTENYQTKSAEISIFGIPLWYPSNTPRTVISPAVQPGECWAFKGFPGYIVVQLNNLIQVSGFTMEHIPQSLAPYGVIDSAPHNFTVWGLETEMDKDPVLFGSYHYSADEGAASVQFFPVENAKVHNPYQIIELRIESNHGNPRYTCLYRFRVHGNVIKG